jgi:hypothetical protein
MKASLALVSMPHMKGLIGRYPKLFTSDCFKLDAGRCAFWVAVDEDFLGELEKQHDITGTASEILAYEADNHARKNRRNTETSDQC